MSNPTHYAQTLQIVQAMVEALQAARESTYIDRTSLAESHRRPDGSMEPGTEDSLKVYDDLLPAADHVPPLCELIRWHLASGTERPDAEITVLLKLTPDGGTVECGWWDGEQWCLCESGGPAVQSDVLAWAYAEGPEA